MFGKAILPVSNNIMGLVWLQWLAVRITMSMSTVSRLSTAAYLLSAVGSSYKQNKLLCSGLHTYRIELLENQWLNHVRKVESVSSFLPSKYDQCKYAGTCGKKWWTMVRSSTQKPAFQSDVARALLSTAAVTREHNMQTTVDLQADVKTMISIYFYREM